MWTNKLGVVSVILVCILLLMPFMVNYYLSKATFSQQEAARQVVDHLLLNLKKVTARQRHMSFNNAVIDYSHMFKSHIDTYNFIPTKFYSALGSEQKSLMGVLIVRKIAIIFARLTGPLKSFQYKITDVQNCSIFNYPQCPVSVKVSLSVEGSNSKPVLFIMQKSMGRWKFENMLYLQMNFNTVFKKQLKMMRKTFGLAKTFEMLKQ